jgi:hypothetical protein
MRPDTLRTRHGYTREETQLVMSTCLTVAVTLGEYMDDLCVVGGLVPVLLFDSSEQTKSDAVLPQTLDLDIGLKLVLLEDERYAAIGEHLRDEGFGPDVNWRGNLSLQTWVDATKRVTIDFLLPESANGKRPGQVQPLERDLGALVTRGLELAFDERVPVALATTTLWGERAERSIHVCGPGAFVVLKALAFRGRGKLKDAFDLVYTLQHWPAGVDDVAKRISDHGARRPDVVRDALEILRNHFATIESLGPRRAAAFEGATGAASDEIAADALGAVDDLLAACAERGLGVPPYAPPAVRGQSAS